MGLGSHAQAANKSGNENEIGASLIRDDRGSIVALDLRHKKLDAQVLRAIAKFGQLNTACFADTDITDDLLACLAGAQIETLDMQRTKITDRGLGHLSAIRSLRLLLLEGPNITDLGLGRLRSLRQLTALVLCDTKTTAEATMALQKALPRCSIMRLARDGMASTQPIDLQEIAKSWKGWNLATPLPGLTHIENSYDFTAIKTPKEMGRFPESWDGKTARGVVTGYWAVLPGERLIAIGNGMKVTTSVESEYLKDGEIQLWRTPKSLAAFGYTSLKRRPIEKGSFTFGFPVHSTPQVAIMVGVIYKLTYRDPTNDIEKVQWWWSSQYLQAYVAFSLSK
jgi:hypothetical protein